MMLLWIPLCGVPLLLAVAALPFWHWSRAWGYLPAAGLGALGLMLLWMHSLYMI